MSAEQEDLGDEMAQADWNDPLNRKDMLAFLRRRSPRTRSTVIRTIEGKVASDNVAFIKEHLEVMEPDLTTRTVDFVSARTCNFGHLLDEKNRLVATASCCGAPTCAVDGCSLNCVRCGKSLCRRHATVFGDGEVYCMSCRPTKWLRISAGVSARVSVCVAKSFWRWLQ